MEIGHHHHFPPLLQLSFWGKQFCFVFPKLSHLPGSVFRASFKSWSQNGEAAPYNTEYCIGPQAFKKPPKTTKKTQADMCSHDHSWYFCPECSFSPCCEHQAWGPSSKLDAANFVRALCPQPVLPSAAYTDPPSKAQGQS